MKRYTKDLSIIVVNWNTSKLLFQCLQSINNTVTKLDFEVIVVDNGSTDESVEMVKKHFKKVRLIENSSNLGFVHANNQALECCQGRNVLLLNSDTRVLPKSVFKMVVFMDSHPNAGAAGVKLINPDGSFQASYTPFPSLMSEILILTALGRHFIRPSFPSYGPNNNKKALKIRGYVEGACLIASHDAIKKTGILDENIFMYAEDVDWCYRFNEAGWEVWYLSDIAVIHYGGQSSKTNKRKMLGELYRSRIYFFRKHYGHAAARLLEILIYNIHLAKILYYKFLRFFKQDYEKEITLSRKELQLVLTRTDYPAK